MCSSNVAPAVQPASPTRTTQRPMLDSSGSASELLAEADIVVRVRAPGGGSELDVLHAGQTLVGLLNPLGSPERIAALAARGVSAFAPRAAAQNQPCAADGRADLNGHDRGLPRGALMAAGELTRMFPLMMTAAGTVTPARVLIVGAGVAGLQAIATAKRLGAVVQSYDVRPAVAEQVESLGARFVDLGLDLADSEDSGGIRPGDG